MSLRHLAAPAVLVGALLAPASPVQAGGASVTAADLAFSPARVTVALGQSVEWAFPEQTLHSTTSNQDFWDSGARNAGETFDRTFNSAGSYRYHCTFHPHMTGTVRVPLKATGSATNGWTLRWATVKAPASRDYDVQVRHAGDDRWKWFRRDTAKATGGFDPARTGSWKIRARTSNTDAGESSGWSPARSVTVS